MEHTTVASRSARLAALTIVLVSTAASAATVRPLRFEALVERADTVVYGRVRGSRSFWDSATRTIWTETEVVVLDGAKGHAASTITVAEPGGALGDVVHVVPGVPRFEPDEELVLFLYQAVGGRLRVLGLRQGVYRIDREPSTGERIAHPAVAKSETIVGEGHAGAPVKPSGGDLPLGRLLEQIRSHGRVR
jgi:hypothetical protein